MQELGEDRLHQAQRRTRVVLAVGLPGDELVELRVELGAQQPDVVAVDQAEAAAASGDRLELLLPAVQAGDRRRAPSSDRSRLSAALRPRLEAAIGSSVRSWRPRSASAVAILCSVARCGRGKVDR
jgi:hypothetical protein